MALTREQLEQAGYPKGLLDFSQSVKGFVGRRLGEVGEAFKPHLGLPKGTDKFLGDFREGVSGVQEFFSPKAKASAEYTSPATPTPLLRDTSQALGGEALDIQGVDKGLGVTEPIIYEGGIPKSADGSYMGQWGDKMYGTERGIREATPITSSVMDSIRTLSTTAQGLQADLDKLRDLPTDTSTVEKKDSYDDQLKQIQLDITNKILANMSAPTDGGVMDRYADREQQIKDASEAAKKIIESRSGVEVEEEKEAGARRLESEREARRGFATNRALFDQIEAKTTKNIRDLEIKRDDALALQDFNKAEKLDSLIEKQEETLSNAKQRNLENLMALSAELRSMRGFETPEEKREAEFGIDLALKGVDLEADLAKRMSDIQLEYADVPGITEATSIHEMVKALGPRLSEDRQISLLKDELDVAKTGYEIDKIIFDTTQASQEDFTLASNLRKEFIANSKNFTTIRDSYSKIQIAEDTGPGDLALIFSYMKMLDPTSVVKEGEFATAENSSGVPSAVRSTYNKIIGGGRLDTKQRTEFTSQANKIYQSEINKHNVRIEDYIGFAERYNLSPQNIIVDLSLGVGADEAGDSDYEPNIFD